MLGSDKRRDHHRAEFLTETKVNLAAGKRFYERKCAGAKLRGNENVRCAGSYAELRITRKGALRIKDEIPGDGAAFVRMENQFITTYGGFFKNR